MSPITDYNSLTPDYESEFTPTHNFESDVMDITPAPDDDGSTQEQEGITPWNKFEDDVLGLFDKDDEPDKPD